MIADSLSTWLGFWTSAAAPKGAMSPMELDGYLAGVVVSPDLLLPSHWLDRIWGENAPTFDSLDQLQTVIAAVMDLLSPPKDRTRSGCSVSCNELTG
jgi:uncharacterized protein